MDMVSSLAMITTRRTLERLTIMVRSLKAEIYKLVQQFDKILNLCAELTKFQLIIIEITVSETIKQ